MDIWIYWTSKVDRSVVDLSQRVQYGSSSIFGLILGVLGIF